MPCFIDASEPVDWGGLLVVIVFEIPPGVARAQTRVLCDWRRPRAVRVALRRDTDSLHQDNPALHRGVRLGTTTRAPSFSPAAPPLRIAGRLASSGLRLETVAVE